MDSQSVIYLPENSDDMLMLWFFLVHKPSPVRIIYSVKDKGLHTKRYFPLTYYLTYCLTITIFQKNPKEAMAAI